MIACKHFLTLTQPWATLMANGSKLIETRSWKTSFRGPLAIHASKSFPIECRRRMLDKHFLTALAATGAARPEDLPLGKVLAVVTVDDCKPTVPLYQELTEAELAFGDYSPGRYGFITSGARRLREPVLMRGLQRIQLLPVLITEDQLL